MKDLHVYMRLKKNSNSNWTEINLMIMNISVELTLCPLQNNYEELITGFIKKLRTTGFTVLENPLSTQVYGDYDDIMKMLQKEIKVVFELMEKGLMYLKIVKTDRSNYEPDF